MIGSQWGVTTMIERMAKGLAKVLGGEAVRHMPMTREWGVELTRPDGKFVSIEGDEHEWGCGYLFPSERSYQRYHTEGFQGTIPDSAEWFNWGFNQTWSEALAFLLGGEAYQNCDNVWVVLFKRADGKFVVIGSDGADIYESETAFNADLDGDSQESEWLIWDHRSE